MKHRRLHLALLLLLATSRLLAGPAKELRVGTAFHAFDHLGNIGEQAGTAASAGVNIIYATGLGGLGYSGLPPEREFTAARSSVQNYNKSAKKSGIRVILGYLCATSIVKLEQFDQNWSPEFRKQFNTSPSNWRQVGRDGTPLPSWYGGDYQPACMNHPDWRAYQRFMVRQQLKTGHDGIFFDNPTVHPKGCYCEFCMEQFAAFLRHKGLQIPPALNLAGLRGLTEEHPQEFLQFRATIARDFLSEMRTAARRINPNALITCNNSLNAPNVLFSQARTYGYNISEKSKVEDLVVVEDMSHQPRLLPGGKTMEYGPTYRQLQSICRGKPLVAVTIAEGDYHTPANLVRLAMAEASAHGASYLAWPTWPENQRTRMAEAILPEAQFLRGNASLLNETRPRTDALLVLPFQQWLNTNRCMASELAAKLTRANVQYQVITEEDLQTRMQRGPGSSKPGRTPLIIESRTSLDPESARIVRLLESQGTKVILADQTDLLEELNRSTKPSLSISAPATVRAVAHDQQRRTIVHLYNLAVERISSFEDRPFPASDVKLRVQVPFREVRKVIAKSADLNATTGPIHFVQQSVGGITEVSLQLPKLELHTILVLQP